MIKWLRKLFGCCEHEWDIFGVKSVFETNDDVNELPIGSIYILQCKKCGDLKKKRF